MTKNSTYFKCLLGRKYKEINWARQLTESYIEKGALVPDEVTINMFLDHISKDDYKNRFILDDFPRKEEQANGLKDALAKKNDKIILVILVEADDEKIIKRLAGWRVW